MHQGRQKAEVDDVTYATEHTEFL